MQRGGQRGRIHLPHVIVRVVRQSAHVHAAAGGGGVQHASPGAKGHLGEEDLSPRLPGGGGQVGDRDDVGHCGNRRAALRSDIRTRRQIDQRRLVLVGAVVVGHGGGAGIAGLQMPPVALDSLEPVEARPGVPRACSHLRPAVKGPRCEVRGVHLDHEITQLVGNEGNWEPLVVEPRPPGVLRADPGELDHLAVEEPVGLGGGEGGVQGHVVEGCAVGDGARGNVGDGEGLGGGGEVLGVPLNSAVVGGVEEDHLLPFF
mmetsp:Transcript_41635/g.94962  ORF Transcript_41635/g.94962 Transcript_41635/m.94962 type:complete len:259 (+) Transcript_41635:608-1384(+)